MAMTMGWNEAHTQTSSAIVRCAKDECDNTELTTKTAILHVRSRVHVVLRVESLDLGFHVVNGVGRLNVQRDGFTRQLHFTTNAIPSAKFFPSGCCSPTVSCQRPLNLYTKFLHNSHRENGSFEVLSLHTASVTVDRRQL